MKRDEFRQKLIDGTIYVIAEEGLDKATTKQVGMHTGVNEAYIYRCFSGKEDMFVKAFEVLDEELLAKAMQHLPVMYMVELDFEIRCRLFFKAIWEFLVGDRRKCLAFVRYYYSPYFSRYSIKDHEKRFAPLVEKFKEAFKEEADVWMILNHILHVMLAFAVMVHNEQMTEKEDNTEHVFRVLYVSVKQYFKNAEKDDFNL